MGRGRAGRKKKAGARTASGALQRVPKWDYGCDGVQRRRALYARETIAPGSDGTKQVKVDAGQTFDALGRAWSAGLLGARADELRDGGRIIAGQYWRAYGFVTPDSLARFQPSAAVGLVDDHRARIIEAALNDALDTVAKRGRDVRRAFDQLVIDLNPDAGPAWLDRIIFASRQHRTPTEADSNMLRLALEGLQQVA